MFEKEVGQRCADNFVAGSVSVRHENGYVHWTVMGGSPKRRGK